MDSCRLVLQTASKPRSRIPLAAVGPACSFQFLASSSGVPNYMKESCPAQSCICLQHPFCDESSSGTCGWKKILSEKWFTVFDVRSARNSHVGEVTAAEKSSNWLQLAEGPSLGGPRSGRPPVAFAQPESLWNYVPNKYGTSSKLGPYSEQKKKKRETERDRKR